MGRLMERKNRAELTRGGLNTTNSGLSLVSVRPNQGSFRGATRWRNQEAKVLEVTHMTEQRLRRYLRG